MPIALPASLRGYLNEPAVPDPPGRTVRDWGLVAVASVAAVLETALRRDHDWLALPLGWRLAAAAAFFVSIPIALLERRRHPLAMLVYALLVAFAFGELVKRVEGPFEGLTTSVVIVIVPYALFRWASGRDGAVGVVVLAAAAGLGTATSPSATVGDWIGSYVFLSIPVMLGLIVRYRTVARERAIAEAKSREREEIARELHDTVAHHVSAIAVQAQAGRAIAARDPARALDVLAVIEAAASRTLGEMRGMVRSLRGGSVAELSPQPGLADLARLVRDVPGGLAVALDVDPDLGALDRTVDAAVYRIAQESITNACRHARRATTVQVRVVADGPVVRITVTDDGESAAADGLQHGYGLLGMAERVHVLGGRFSAGPATTGRGWQVNAELPRQETP